MTEALIKVSPFIVGTERTVISLFTIYNVFLVLKNVQYCCIPRYKYFRQHTTHALFLRISYIKKTLLHCKLFEIFTLLCWQ